MAWHPANGLMGIQEQDSSGSIIGTISRKNVTQLIMRVPTSTGMFSLVSVALFAFDVAQIIKDRTTSRTLILKEMKGKEKRN